MKRRKAIAVIGTSLLAPIILQPRKGKEVEQICRVIYNKDGSFSIKKEDKPEDVTWGWGMRINEVPEDVILKDAEIIKKHIQNYGRRNKLRSYRVEVEQEVVFHPQCGKILKVVVRGINLPNAFLDNIKKLMKEIAIKRGLLRG